jgi:hypothetical protein
MYRVEFWLCAAGRGGYGLFRREAALPFVPAAGLLLCFPGDEPGAGREVLHAAWLLGEGRLACRLADDTDPEADWGEVRDRLASRGWRLEEEALGGAEDTWPSAGDGTLAWPWGRGSAA